MEIMANLEDTIKTAKDKLPDLTPTPPDLHQQATAHELKSRLNWGEPALTIVDVRDRDSFNAYRILGAIAMPLDALADRAQNSLEKKRDIYVYGDNDSETAEAANLLRQSGFTRVAELQGGLTAWKEIGGPVEGTATKDDPPSPGAYNVGSRLKEFAAEKAEERSME
jgi:rhodanese-related sulfurtransferase